VPATIASRMLSSTFLSKSLKIEMYRIIILPVILCGCETWSLRLMGKHRLRVFQNKVLREIFGRQRVEVTGDRMKLHI